ncbi:MAG: hypothetical protein COA79_21205 [Planctomycetota bacterium]|nr:MAG: hypothetical protein COA79_21205 [Planctomycetota bacterium]
MKNIIILLIAFFLLIGISTFYQSQHKKMIISPPKHSLRTKILKVLMKDKNTRQHTSLEILSSKNITIYKDHIALHLFGDQQLLNNGIRSEISIDVSFVENDIIVYEWAMMLPHGFIHDAPKNRWWSVAQWHDQPDTSKGESWNNFPSHSPPVALYFGYLKGKFYLSPVYMYKNPSKDDLIEVKLGQWIKFKIEINWSQVKRGHLKIWVNDQIKPSVYYKGANMLNSYQHYMKIGMYRSPEIKTNNTIKFKELDIRKISNHIMETH